MSGTSGHRPRSLKTVDWSALFRTQPNAAALDVALIAVRIALTWVFLYYGAGKLFGAFNGPGIHGTALYFSNTAHLHPGGLFAVLGGVIEFGGAIAIGLGFFSRLAAFALFGDQVVAMITVTWASGFGSLSGSAGYQFNVTLAVLAVVIMALGAGRLSIDNVIAGRLSARQTGAGGDRPSPLAAPETAPQPVRSDRQVVSTIGTDDAD
jgi:putative oxidoreductase